MTIRPEDLQRNEPSRLSVHQTFGDDGGFVDSFGPGVASLSISGHTGWRGTQYFDGTALFDQLRTTVFQEWHAARKRAVAQNQDPDQVKLIFVDALDNFSWVCAPQQFTLRRSKSQPLLMKYNISLLKLGDDLSDTTPSPTNGAGLPTNPVAALQQRTSALSSLQQSIANINAFNARMVGSFAAALGNVTGPLASFSAMTVGTLQQVLDAATGGPVGVAQQLSLAAAQVTGSLGALGSMPAMVQASLVNVSAEFRNAFCLIGNVFSRNQSYVDYRGFYGSSNCSSTWAGGQVSPYAISGTSGLAALYPAQASTNAQTSVQAAAVGELAAMDTVLNPQSADWMGARMKEAVGG